MPAREERRRDSDGPRSVSELEVVNSSARAGTRMRGALFDEFGLLPRRGSEKVLKIRTEREPPRIRIGPSHHGPGIESRGK